jgi:Holliday junction resolvase RusA-like endonuclease
VVSETVVINLPGVPRGKGRPRFSVRGGHARAYTDAQTESYEGALRLAASQAMSGEPPLEGALALIMTAVFPVPASWSRLKRSRAMMGQIRPTGKPDVDNLLKSVADGMNQIVYKDDAQLVSALVMKEYGPIPGITITINSIVGSTQ